MRAPLVYLPCCPVPNESQLPWGKQGELSWNCVPNLAVRIILSPSIRLLWLIQINGSYLARSMGLPPSDPPSPTIRISVTRGTESGSSAPAVVSEEMEEGFLATGVVPSVRTSAAAKVDMISTAFYQNIRHDEYWMNWLVRVPLSCLGSKAGTPLELSENCFYCKANFVTQ